MDYSKILNSILIATSFQFVRKIFQFFLTLESKAQFYMSQKLIEAKYEEYRNLICHYLVNNYRRWCMLEPDLPIVIYHDALKAIWVGCNNGTINLQEDFYNLVLKISKQKIIDYTRKEHRKLGKELIGTENLENLPTDDENTRIRKILFEQCFYELHQKKITELDKNCQLMLTYAAEGKRWTEIAEILKISGRDPAHNARQRASECRIKLRMSVKADNSCDEFKD